MYPRRDDFDSLPYAYGVTVNMQKALYVEEGLRAFFPELFDMEFVSYRDLRLDKLSDHKALQNA